MPYYAKLPVELDGARRAAARPDARHRRLGGRRGPQVCKEAGAATVRLLSHHRRAGGHRGAARRAPRRRDLPRRHRPPAERERLHPARASATRATGCGAPAEAETPGRGTGGRPRARVARGRADGDSNTNSGRSRAARALRPTGLRQRIQAAGALHDDDARTGAPDERPDVGGDDARPVRASTGRSRQYAPSSRRRSSEMPKWWAISSHQHVAHRLAQGVRCPRRPCA